MKFKYLANNKTVELTDSELIKMIRESKARSAWDKGLKLYAEELIDQGFNKPIEFHDLKELETILLNGARNWKEFSYGGCSLIYDGDIAERLLPTSRLKRCNYGEKNPNKNELWIDVQARALYQAFLLIRHLFIYTDK